METHKRLEPGRTLGGYRIERFLNEGGMGTIYLATQLSMNRRVALKVLSHAFTRDAEQVEAFAQEARTLAVLDHANVITAFDVGQDEGIYYLAMAYFDGADLSARVHRYGPLPERRALVIALKSAQALDYGWEKFHLLHLDIKPSNIMVNNEGEVRLLDLGLARQTREITGLDMKNYFEGTPLYASPEQLRGATDIDYRADIFSLGSTLYYMVTGIQPYSQYPHEQLFNKQDLPPVKNARQVNPKVSQRTATFIAKMMEHQRMKRPASWKDVVAALEHLLTPPAKARAAARGRSTALPKKISVQKIKPAVAAAAGARAAQKSKTPAIPILVAVVVAAAGAFFFLKNVHLGPPGGSAPTVQNPTKEDEQTARARALLERVDEVRYFAATHPADLETTLTMYQKILADAGNDPVAQSIRDEVAALTDAVAARERERKARERAQIEERAREDVKTRLCEELAVDLLAFDFEAARTRLAATANSAFGADLKDVLTEYQEIVEAVADIPALIIEGFAPYVDETIEVGLRSGRTRLTIRSVGRGGITVASEIRRNGELIGESGREIRLNELSLVEMLKRLTRDDIPHADLLKGLLAYRARELTPCRHYLEKVDTDLGRILLTQVEASRDNW